MFMRKRAHMWLQALKSGWLLRKARTPRQQRLHKRTQCTSSIHYIHVKAIYHSGCGLKPSEQV